MMALCVITTTSETRNKQLDRFSAFQQISIQASRMRSRSSQHWQTDTTRQTDIERGLYYDWLASTHAHRPSLRYSSPVGDSAQLLAKSVASG